MTKSSPDFEAVVAQRYSRREMLQVLGATSVVVGLGCTAKNKAATPVSKQPLATAVTKGFVEVTHGADDRHHVPAGYRAEVLIGWGDSLSDGSPASDLGAMTPETQAARFGTNCDYTAFIPLPAKDGRQRGLLCVNHEFSDAGKMFPGVPAGRRKSKRCCHPGTS